MSNTTKICEICKRSIDGDELQVFEIYDPDDPDATFYPDTCADCTFAMIEHLEAEGSAVTTTNAPSRH